MDEEFIKQCLAEIVEATSEALGHLAAAIARTGDAMKLAEEMRAQLHAARSLQANPVALRIATRALAAFDAEAALQNRSKH